MSKINAKKGRWLQWSGGIAIVVALLLDLVGWMPMPFLERLARWCWGIIFRQGLPTMTRPR
ncbi:MAG: hypothetical protein LC677_12025 [Halomonas sp.]|nr:hypothetical protein [Halomonas sp.]